MIDLIKDAARYVYQFITHRILWLFIASVALFGALVLQLFELQIVLAHTFLPPPPVTNEVTIPIPAHRGSIYDRHGRPLAVNRLVFVAKMDPSVPITNEALLDLALLLEANEEQYIDEFPISLDPFEFIDDRAHVQNHWKREIVIPNYREATAEESFLFLRERERIDPDMSHEDARRILNFRSMIFMQRLIWIEHFNPVPILFAIDISQETVAAIEERSSAFTGMFIDVQTKREYPAGIYMSHIIGYIRQITAEDLEANEHLGYTHQCLFGRQGLERNMEQYLRGTPGQQLIQFNGAGQRIGQPIIIQEPQPGDRLFLTIDLELQMAAYNMLKDYLAQVLINRINLRHPRERAVTLQEVFTSFVNGHNLDVRTVLEVEDGPAMAMQRYILQRFPDAGTSRDDILQINSIITEGIRSQRISPAKMLLTLIGTGQITDPDGTIEQQLLTRPGTARDVLVQKISEWEITPQQVNMDPSTGSIVIVDVPTGAVLAAVSYPSFDNNRLVNNMDVDYFNHINFLDPTHPAIPRAFREPRAPGSNFKMITAVAALDSGAILPNTRIRDGVAFTRAGRPPLHCWHRGGHGSINVAQAIAVSCNYFFAEAAWRMGTPLTTAETSTLQRIDTLNRYMMHFGLHESSGVEILELFDQPLRYPDGTLFEGSRMSSPEFMRFQMDQQWFDGDTVRTAMGQSLNNYTVAQMARAMNVFANRGVNYPLHMVGHIENSLGGIVMRTEPEPVCIGLEFSESTWDAVTEGMRLVTQPGASGTAVHLFHGQSFPIPVAGKTSTTQQIPTRFPHSAFGAFAPIENPQISIYVNIPFGSTLAYQQISARIARDMIAVALGQGLEAEGPEPLHTLRPN